MIELLNNLIEIITYTPTLYVDGMACEVDCAWVQAAIAAGGAILGGIMSAVSSSSAARKQAKAARKNYNMLMDNAEMSRMTLNEQIDDYEEDMDSYRSSMIQRYGLAGGLRSTDAGLNEVRDYEFGVEDISQKVNERVGEAWSEKMDEYITKNTGREIYGKGDEHGNDVVDVITEGEASQMAYKKYTGDWTAKKTTDYLEEELYNYKGKQTNFKTPATNSAILNLQTSVTNMQKDINNAYKAGMIDYWQQRKNAQDVLDTGNLKSAGYSTQAQTTLASSFISAIGYGAESYARYKGIS